MSGDHEAAEWREFEDYIRSTLLPALQGSAVSMVITPDAEPDIKIAVELGLSILMDKPIVAVVLPGRPMPEKLAKLADAIIEADPSTREGQRELARFVHDRLHELIGGETS